MGDGNALYYQFYFLVKVHFILFCNKTLNGQKQAIFLSYLQKTTRQKNTCAISSLFIE